MHLTIGTAQFGLKYGLKRKKIQSKEMLKIKKILNKKKVSYFDTAMKYGGSERKIGDLNINKKK